MVDEPLPNDSQEMAVLLAGSGRSVLEIGCGAGHVTERLVARGSVVTGIEIDPDAAREAERHAEVVHVADLDLVPLSDLLADQRFDVIVVGDVFEHLKNPSGLLRQFPAHLHDNGTVVSSIPNVTHGDVRLMLQSGRWQMLDSGLMDRTHLRFFDLRGVIELFTDSGFAIERLERTRKDVGESELAPYIDPRLPEEIREWTAEAAEATTYQFVVVARPGEADGTELRRFAADDSAIGDGATVLPADAESGNRLLVENEQLRVKVRALEEQLEDLHWIRAEWRDRLQQVRALPGALSARVRDRARK